MYEYDEIAGSTTKYSMNLIYLVDVSGSMKKNEGERINQLNVAMTEAVQVAEETAIEREIDLYMRVIKFNSKVEWLYGDVEKGVTHIDWKPLIAEGGTDTAEAIRCAKQVMRTKYLGERNYKPVVILITDGESNEPNETIKAIEELKTSLKSSTGEAKDKITRISIGVVDANRSELESFASIGNIERSDGTVEKNVPLVLSVSIDDLSMLKSLLKSVTVSSIMSATSAQDDDNVTTIVETKDDNEWAI